MYKAKNELGIDYFNLKSKKYVYTIVFKGGKTLENFDGKIPEDLLEWSDVVGFNKQTQEFLCDDDIADLNYDNVIVSKERLETIGVVTDVLQNIIEESGVNEPFVFEDGVLSVGKENVLSAHINAGYDHGWISSSICW